MSSTGCNTTSKTLWVGIDVAKLTVEAAIEIPVDPASQPAPLHELPTASFSRTEQGAGEMIEWFAQMAARFGMKPNQVRVVMESTGGYSKELAQWLAAKCPSLAPAIVNASVMASFAASVTPRHKTDKSDARVIARYGAFQRPAPADLQSAERHELTQLVRYREWLVRERTREKNKLQAPMLPEFIKRDLEKNIERLGSRIEKIEKRIASLSKKDKKMSRDLALVRTIHGVGPVTAITVLAELGDLRRFGRARQLSAFAGLSPRRAISGTSLDKKGSITKIGNSRCRRVLLMAAWASIRRPGPFREFYNSLVKNGKTKLEAQVALMRKILVLMRAILISGEPFDPARL